MIMKAIKQLFSRNKPSKRLQGTIKFFDRKKRYGFIIVGKHEYFFHGSGVRSKDFNRLRDGALVEFALVQGKKGLQADEVIVVG